MEKEMEKIKDALVFIGYTQENAEKQIIILNNAVAGAILNQIIQENPGKILNNENIKDFINQNYSDDKITNISMQVSEPIIKNFFEEITSNLEESKKKYFYKILE